LQSFTKFNELLLLPSIGDPTKTSSAVVSMSAGLTAKKCWNRMTQSAATMQQLAKEVSVKFCVLCDMHWNKAVRF